MMSRNDSTFVSLTPSLHALRSRRSEELAGTEPTSVYKSFHERLRKWRMNNKEKLGVSDVIAET